ncbi:MAG: response regulator [Pirellulaceae bacterium]|nr:response regulator [Planctomycetales bacterium]MCA9164323.1 response regulator [Planctomycetales bacterium]MCA9267300.1 response regulator [Planctomycetales bacterium]
MSETPAKLLVVEDSATDAEVLSYYLRKSRRGFEVQLVRDGNAALETLRDESPEQRPKLVLLDLNLPKLGGFEVLRAIKTDPRLSELPVVILTASVLEEDLERANHLQADAYLSKPFDAAGFQEVVETVERLASA